MKRLVAQLAAVGFFALFLLTAILTTRNLVTALASRSWSTAPGVIKMSGIRESSSPTARGSMRRVFKPLLEYEYHVGSAVFTSSQISFADPTSAKRADVEAINQRYPYGQRVQVYHSPSSPEISILEPGPTWHTWLGPLISVPFTGVLAVALALWMVRERRTLQATAAIEN